MTNMSTMKLVVIFVAGSMMATVIAIAQHAENDTTGIVIQPEEGEVLELCGVSELSVNIKVSPGLDGPTFAMGTAELAANADLIDNHEAFDEVIFIHSGKGSVTIGDEVFRASSGTTVYVPRGVHHGFMNTGETPWVFVWITSPPGFEEGLRQLNVASARECSQLNQE